AIRNFKDRSRLRLVHGRHAGLPLGGLPSRHGGKSRHVCGMTRGSPYNHVFLEGVKAAVTADPMFRDGRFVAKPSAGLRAMGRIYAGWAMSHAFYRDEVWREAGFHSLEDYLARTWDDAFSKRDANNLLAQIGIWQRGDISRCPEFAGDIDRALAAIKARVL